MCIVRSGGYRHLSAGNLCVHLKWASSHMENVSLSDHGMKQRNRIVIGAQSVFHVDISTAYWKATNNCQSIVLGSLY